MQFEITEIGTPQMNNTWLDIWAKYIYNQFMKENYPNEYERIQENFLLYE